MYSADCGVIVSIKKKLKRQTKAVVMMAAKRSAKIDTIFRGALASRQGKRYKEITSKSTVDRRTVVFSSFMGRGFNDSPKAIFAYMVDSPQYANWTFVWAFRGGLLKRYKALRSFALRARELGIHSESSVLTRQLLRMKMVRYGSLAHYQALASSRYIVSNSRMSDGIVPSDEQVYIQTWHGTPLKRLGADIEIDKAHPTKQSQELAAWYRLEASKWSFVLAQNEYGKEKMVSSFGLKDLNRETAIIAKGYPRNDALYTYGQDDVSRIKAILALPAGKKIALYAPTFRDDQHTATNGYVYNIGCDFLRLKEKLGDDWVILFRAHYFVARDFDFGAYRGFVVDTSQYGDINDLYIVSDILITDYSSMVFDYSNLRKPMLIYAYDYDHYRSNVRGFYLDLKDLPAKIVTNEAEVCHVLNNLSAYSSEWMPRIEEFASVYNKMEDGYVTERVLREIIDKEDTE